MARFCKGRKWTGRASGGPHRRKVRLPHYPFQHRGLSSSAADSGRAATVSRLRTAIPIWEAKLNPCLPGDTVFIRAVRRTIRLPARHLIFGNHLPARHSMALSPLGGRALSNYGTSPSPRRFLDENESGSQVVTREKEGAFRLVNTDPTVGNTAVDAFRRRAICTRPQSIWMIAKRCPATMGRAAFYALIESAGYRTGEFSVSVHGTAGLCRERWAGSTTPRSRAH